VVSATGAPDNPAGHLGVLVEAVHRTPAVISVRDHDTQMGGITHEQQRREHLACCHLLAVRVDVAVADRLGAAASRCFLHPLGVRFSVANFRSRISASGRHRELGLWGSGHYGVHELPMGLRLLHSPQQSLGRVSVVELNDC
jgi:hypothetical protein